MLRILRKYTFFDSKRKYKIYIDNVYCGDIVVQQIRSYCSMQFILP